MLILPEPMIEVESMLAVDLDIVEPGVERVDQQVRFEWDDDRRDYERYASQLRGPGIAVAPALAVERVVEPLGWYIGAVLYELVRDIEADRYQVVGEIVGLEVD